MSRLRFAFCGSIAAVLAAAIPARAQTVADGIDASGLVGVFENSAALLDETNLPSGVWQFDNATTHDGIDSVKALLPNRSENLLKTKIQGPATVSFWWKLDAVNYFDSIRFDSSNDLASVTGVQDWQQRSFIVDCGEQALQWSFTRFASLPVGTGSAWLDQLVVTPIPNNSALQSALDHFDHTIHSTDWTGHTLTNSQNGVVAKSGPVGSGGKTSMVLEVEGPAVVRFNWGIQSDETAESTLSFLIDNAEYTNISGVQELHERRFQLKPGTHCLKFLFIRDFDSAGDPEYQGAHEGYVDNLRIDTYGESAGLAAAIERDSGVYSNAWTTTTSDTRDGVDAVTVSAPDINDSKILFVELPSEAGLLSFWSKIKSEPDHGFLYAFVDGEIVMQRSGVHGWVESELNLPAISGSRLLELYLYRDGNSSTTTTDYEAWIDQIRFSPGETNYQADMAIAPKGKRLLGENIMNRSGARQTANGKAAITRPFVRYQIAAKNGSPTDNDRIYYRGVGSTRKFDIFFVVKVDNKLLNYTSALRTGQFTSLELEPGEMEKHELWIARKQGERSRNHRYTIIGKSKTDPRKQDTVRTRTSIHVK